MKPKTHDEKKTLQQMLQIATEVVRNTLEHIDIRNNFLKGTQMAQHLREGMNKWDCIKLRSFCTSKETVTRLKRLLTEWENMFASYSSNVELIFRIYKKLRKLNPQRINIPMKKWARELNKQFSKEEVQVANKHMKKCSFSLATKERQINGILRFHLTPVRMAIFMA
jgi:hypothetical protein